MQSDWPRPTCVVWCTASYVSVPDLDTMPDRTKTSFHNVTYLQQLTSIQLPELYHTCITEVTEGEQCYIEMEFVFIVLLWQDHCATLWSLKQFLSVSAVAKTSVDFLPSKKTVCKGSMAYSGTDTHTSYQAVWCLKGEKLSDTNRGKHAVIKGSFIWEGTREENTAREKYIWVLVKLSFESSHSTADKSLGDRGIY